ncbi:hypothetical protein [Sphingomonas sp. RIT328]|uniref:hypothetical protein n=1 Tax=Sphingomonas sp. RIT328 TaxID=1470591 RepID=UPI00044A9D13|nr:hypothetical protein [Sphingomonas sp. RIT328]EZP57282.1 hypothetical protein BW41_00125 [Sphingomonas sp. RIT328]
MALMIDTREEQFASDLDFLLHFQNVLLRAVEGARDAAIDQEYRAMRAALIADPKYEQLVPEFVNRHHDLGSLWPTLKSFSPQWEPRRVEVRRQFKPSIAQADRADPFASTAQQQWLGDPPYDSTAWTGGVTTASRLASAKTLLPVARAAVERLIESLDEPRHNGGPPLDETVEAIQSLRALHSLLGEIIDAADDGALDRAYNEGMVAEACRYAKRAAKKLRDDPMPYAMSALLLAVFTACGFPGVGGYLGGVAANVHRK